MIGVAILVILGGLILAGLGGAIGGSGAYAGFAMTAFGPIGLISGIIICSGLFTVEPNEAVVLEFCGKYVGTFKEPGFFWANPFYQKIKMSMKNLNFNTT